MVTAGKVFRMAAGAKPLVDGEKMAVRLRIGGQTVGVLLLTGPNLDLLRLDTLYPLALHFATTLQGLAAEKQRQFLAHTSTIIRRLFEQGMEANTVEEASRILVVSFAEAFRTEYAVVGLIDPEGRIRHMHSVGLDDGDEKLAHLIGMPATEVPVWNATADGKPALIADAASAASMPNGPIMHMGLKSYVAIPIRSAHGPVGTIVCGEGTRREWTSRDRILAEQLSVEGGLIVDSAGMRQAAQAHVAQLSHQAFHDSLTGLPNRSYLLERAEQAVELAAATGTRTALMLLDLNGFKEVNDTAGHHAGDALLQQVSKRLLGAVREVDVVSRLGGDEFAILLTRDPDEQVAAAVAGRIVERLREPFTIEGKEVRIGGSVGIAMFPEDADAYEDLMRSADTAMYVAKRDTKRLGGGSRRAQRERGNAA
jgi:diguanylate cyclase (GGDEF)-like protein